MKCPICGAVNLSEDIAQCECGFDFEKYHDGISKGKVKDDTQEEGGKVVEKKATTLSVRYPAASSEGKDWLVTLLLAILVGGFGIHRFYTGRTGTAVVILLLSLLGSLTFIFYIGAPMLLIVGVWVLVDIIRIDVGSFTDVNGTALIKR